MNILICINCVLDTNSKLEINKNKIRTKNVIINPIDELCVNKIISIKNTYKNIHITLLNIGCYKNDPILLKMLSLGADKAIRINVEEINNNIDIVSNNIAKLINNSNYDIVIMGEEGIDYNNSSTHGIIAGKCNYKYINSCTNIEILNHKIICNRKSNNYKEKIEISTKTIISCKREIFDSNNLLIPTMKNIVDAKKKGVQIIENEIKKSTVNILNYHIKNIERKNKIITNNELDTLVDIIKNNL